MIKELILQNFRGFKEYYTEFDPCFNVVIGNNGTGKTTIIDAVAIMASSLFAGIDKRNTKGIAYEDIRLQSFESNIELQLPCSLEGTLYFNDNEFEIIRRREKEKGKTKLTSNGPSIKEYASELQGNVRENNKVNLPVFAYYSTLRLGKDKKTSYTTSPKSSRFDGYNNATEARPIGNGFIKWMKTHELGALQKSIEPISLNLIKQIILNFLNDAKNIYFDVVEDALMLERMNANHQYERLPWYALSDGYRNIISIAADIAIRCIQLNPHLKEEAANKTQGIVLIDEIDQHLHPQWQKTIVSSFKKSFPCIQFIATTHSPIIIQSLKNEELIDLEGKDMQVDYFNKGIEEILENEMQVDNPRRSKIYLKKLKAAEDYFKILELRTHKKLMEGIDADEKLKELEIEFRDDPAYVALLKSENRSKL